MEFPRSKPAYHHPIPWQIVVALVLIGASLLSLAYLAALLWVDYDSRIEDGREAMLWPLVATALAVVVQVAVAVCIAARMDWARRIGSGMCLFTGAVASVSGLVAGVAAPSFTGIGVVLILFFLLRAEKAERYTYRGRAMDWPDD
ncbi:hypothetical protein [Glycomyces arizonensis]|uniref:hypothetical protein n=1 Tax=Glycomyces arizonensis TaxID=256035 RepID=UPI0003FA9911|nr:hypothetical protein [Glycomyces arizonensis]